MAFQLRLATDPFKNVRSIVTLWKKLLKFLTGNSPVFYLKRTAYNFEQKHVLIQTTSKLIYVSVYN